MLTPYRHVLVLYIFCSLKYLGNYSTTLRLFIISSSSSSSLYSSSKWMRKNVFFQKKEKKKTRELNCLKKIECDEFTKFQIKKRKTFFSQHNVLDAINWNFSFFIIIIFFSYTQGYVYTLFFLIYDKINFFFMHLSLKWNLFPFDCELISHKNDFFCVKGDVE